ncbi:MAG: DUF3135 domain-containing protein [Kangiellaceae bacterium]
MSKSIGSNSVGSESVGLKPSESKTVTLTTNNKSHNRLTSLPEFDFDEWMQLYKNDPEAFEEKRIEWLTTCVVDAPQKYQKRLNGLMFHINAIRRLEKNPMQTCLKVSSMMMDSLNDMRVFLRELQATIQGEKSTLKTEECATVLQFSRSS